MKCVPKYSPTTNKGRKLCNWVNSLHQFQADWGSFFWQISWEKKNLIHSLSFTAEPRKYIWESHLELCQQQAPFQFAQRRIKAFAETFTCMSCTAGLSCLPVTLTPLWAAISVTPVTRYRSSDADLHCFHRLPVRPCRCCFSRMTV